jgi:sugar-specific transcriptional regulator TrmB
MNETQITYLMDIGLSKLQSRIYISLLTESRQTGYRIAKTLREPVANTYKALEGLISKGLALMDESGSNKIYTAVSVSGYLNEIETTFAKKRDLIETELKKIVPAKVQDGIFKIENINQLYEITDRIIKNADGIIAIDSSPLPLKIIKPQLQKIAATGVKVIVKAYQDISIPGCEIVCLKEMRSTIDKKPVQFFNISNPGFEYVTALLNYDNSLIIEAIVSKSKYLSFMTYNGIASEFALTNLLSGIIKNANPLELKKYWDKMDYIRPDNYSQVADFFKSIETYKT